MGVLIAVYSTEHDLPGVFASKKGRDTWSRGGRRRRKTRALMIVLPHYVSGFVGDLRTMHLCFTKADFLLDELR